MTWLPDHSFVLSLPDAVERRTHMRGTVKRLGFSPLLTDAIDGSAIDVPSTWLSSPQAYGNAQSHRKVLTGQTGTLMVLEDDAFIPGDFQARLNTVLLGAPDWEIIMLGGQHVRPPMQVGPGVVRCLGTMRSIGYLIRGRAIPRTVAAIDRSVNHWDNAWQDVQRGVNTYAPDPFIITPTGHDSSIPDSTPYS